MPLLTLVAVKEEISNVNRHIMQMEESQNYLKSMGLLEGRHQATIPQKPKLDSLVFSMAQAEIKAVAFHSKVAAGVNIQKQVHSAFTDLDKAYGSLSEVQLESMLAEVLETVASFLELTSGTIRVLGEFSGQVSDLENRNSLIRSIAFGKGCATSDHGADSKIVAVLYKEAMDLSPETNHVTKEEIIEALNIGDFKGEFFRVSTLNSGIKFQFTKPALQAINQTLQNLQSSQKLLDETSNEFKNELTRITTEYAVNALSREEHRANITARIKEAANKAN